MENKGNKKFIRKSKVRAGSKNDPVLKKTITLLETKYRQGYPVKFTELSKELNITRPNLMRRAEALVENKVLIRIRRKYYRFVAEKDRRKMREFRFIDEANTLIQENQKKKKYEKIRSGKVFAMCVMPATKEEYEKIDKFCIELESIISKYITGKKFIGLLVNFP